MDLYTVRFGVGTHAVTDAPTAGAVVTAVYLLIDGASHWVWVAEADVEFL